MGLAWRIRGAVTTSPDSGRVGIDTRGSTTDRASEKLRGCSLEKSAYLAGAAKKKPHHARSGCGFFASASTDRILIDRGVRRARCPRHRGSDASRVKLLKLGGIALDPERQKSKRHANRSPPEAWVFRRTSRVAAHLPGAPRPRIDARRAWMVRSTCIRGRGQIASTPGLGISIQVSESKSVHRSFGDNCCDKQATSSRHGQKKPHAAIPRVWLFCRARLADKCWQPGRRFSEILGNSASSPISNFPMSHYVGAPWCRS